MPPKRLRLSTVEAKSDGDAQCKLATNRCLAYRESKRGVLLLAQRSNSISFNERCLIDRAEPRAKFGAVAAIIIERVLDGRAFSVTRARDKQRRGGRCNGQ